MSTSLAAAGAKSVDAYRPAHKVRFVTATSLFDGHDASINIMRRILQASGAEVIHLGHDRSVKDVVDAAIQEDAQGIAVSSYQGGHMEYFRYMQDLLRERGAGHIRVFGGGGGTIIPEEKRELEDYGIARIYHPEDGRRMGLQGMINDMLELTDHSLASLDGFEGTRAPLTPTDHLRLGRAITLAEAAAHGELDPAVWRRLSEDLTALAPSAGAPLVGVTGTGGAGKSSFVDELTLRYLEDFPERRVAILSVDPTKRRTGGALLGDRIRVNATQSPRVYMRSLATRESGSEVSAALGDAIALCRAAGFDLVIAETSGIGQADASIVELVDLSIYVMTPEFGAQTQLEKIEMIDLADMVVINKFDKPGADDALGDVRKAFQRARDLWHADAATMPVYPAISSQWGDHGVNLVYRELLGRIAAATGHPEAGRFTLAREAGLPERHPVIPPKRVRYLSGVSEAVRRYKARADEQAEAAGELWALRKAIAHFTAWPAAWADALRPFDAEAIAAAADHLRPLMEAFNAVRAGMDPAHLELIAEWPDVVASYAAEVNAYEVRGRQISVINHSESLAHQPIPKVALPRLRDFGSILRWRLLENVPGGFPYAAGVFPYKRAGEDPTRMFAGEGGPWRTNKRFHYLSRHVPAKRLSTAFDSATLYGQDPDRRPDIWGKVGNSGVSIATVEDMEALYAGFDLTSPSTSVSMTINGPAPIVLSFFFNAASRQTLRRRLKAAGKIDLSDADCLQPDGGGYGFDDLRAMVSDDEWDAIVRETVARCRGTVQADILKEDQAQNTCIFSTEFALSMQGDMQAWFIERGVHNFYSVSISGYHIAEAGANPITQLAFTLANGFTFVEYFLSRGMAIDAFGPNLSFFFSNGMDPEYAVIGRVARRIWSVAMRDIYGGHERTQKLKYHVQTSGRSLHAQEVDFNDIRTTLQALLAIYDNCNSLHTNSYDEAVTTPSEASARRALAVQLIIGREFGLAKNENPNQGAFIIDELTELVEQAVLEEFDRLTDRGGVLGAMERMYQRSKIQEESLHYERLKHTGEHPIVGVNTFCSEAPAAEETTLELMRSTEEEKEDQLRRLEDFHRRHADRAPAAAERLKATALAHGNMFDEIMRAVQCMSLGQITHTLYALGGQYRRNM